MQIIRDTTEFVSPGETAVSIGKFDGVVRARPPFQSENLTAYILATEDSWRSFLTRRKRAFSPPSLHLTPTRKSFLASVQNRF